MIMAFGVLLSVAISSPLALAPREQTSKQVKALERGSIEDRLGALNEILKVPSEQRDPAAWRAIAREATRMLKRLRAGQIPYDDDARETNDVYWATLTLALGQSHDPSVIPLLVAYSAHSGPAFEAVVRFGDLAVPATLQVVRGENDDLEQREGATEALAEILQKSASGAPLSEESRHEIGSLAEQLLADKFTAQNTLGIARLVLATHRPDLRKKLEEFAINREAWTRRGPVHEGMITEGQRIILRELQKTKNP